MPKKPIILNTTTLAQSRLFTIQQLRLNFSNGEQRDYERIVTHSHGAVLIVALLKPSTALLVKEYAAGTDRYELVFPKGLIDKGESVEDAANRELMEEIGYGAHSLSHISTMSVAPGYLSFDTHIVLAEDLYEHRLAGDEPEPLEVVHCHLNQLDSFIQRPDLTEARSIASLYMVRDILLKR